MSTLRQLPKHRAELTGLRQLLGSATDEVFEKPLLQSKIAAREGEPRHPRSEITGYLSETA